MNTAGLFRSALELRYQLIVAPREQARVLRTTYWSLLDEMANCGIAPLQRLSVAVERRVARYCWYRVEGLTEGEAFDITGIEDVDRKASSLVDPTSTQSRAINGFQCD